jgi:hypothetical protein
MNKTWMEPHRWFHTIIRPSLLIKGSLDVHSTYLFTIMCIYNLFIPNHHFLTQNPMLKSRIFLHCPCPASLEI